MTATELLRAKLDELGVEPTHTRTRVYKGYENPVNHYTRWKSSYGATCWYHENEQQGTEPITCLKIEGHDITPEQAIAATVGAGTCEWCKDGKTFDRQTVMMTNHGWQKIRHCPNCGRRLEVSE